MLNGHKFQHVEMIPNKPQYLNQRTSHCFANYAFKLPTHSQNIDYDKSILRPRLIQMATEKEQHFDKVKSENDRLQLQIIQLENKAQLAENKLLYRIMNEEKVKYEKLSSQMNSRRNSRIDSIRNPLMEPLNNSDIKQNVRSSSFQQQYRKDQKTDILSDYDMPQLKGDLKHYEEFDNNSVFSQQLVLDQASKETLGIMNNQPLQLSYQKNTQYPQYFNDRRKPQNQQIKTELPTEFYYSSYFNSNQTEESVYPQSNQIEDPVRKSIIKNKFRNICHTIIAGIRLSKQSKIKENQILKRREILNKKIKEISSQVNNNLNLERNWVKQMIWKMVGTMMQPSFYEQYNKTYNPQSEISKDIRQRWTIIFAKQCFQCIELLTRYANIPYNLINKMKLQVFKSENQTVSQFLALRTKLIAENSMTLTAKSKKLILNEFFIFNVIINNMFQLSNRIQYQNVIHQQECKVLFMSVATLLQIYFIQIFEGMPQIQENLTQQTTVQRIVLCQDKMSLNIQLKVNQNQLQNQESQPILKGLYPSNFRIICKMNKKVQDELEILFVQIVNNINNNIQI